MISRTFLRILKRSALKEAETVVVYVKTGRCSLKGNVNKVEE